MRCTRDHTPIRRNIRVEMIRKAWKLSWTTSATREAARSVDTDRLAGGAEFSEATNPPCGT